jgi:hypothetical protein
MKYCHAESLLRRLHILVGKADFEAALGVLSKAEQCLALAGEEGEERMHEVHALYQRTRGDYCWAQAQIIWARKKRSARLYDQSVRLAQQARKLYLEYAESKHFYHLKWKASDPFAVGHIHALSEHDQDKQRLVNAQHVHVTVKETAVRHGYEAIRAAQFALQTFQMATVKECQKMAGR